MLKCTGHNKTILFKKLQKPFPLGISELENSTEEQQVYCTPINHESLAKAKCQVSYSSMWYFTTNFRHNPPV